MTDPMFAQTVQELGRLIISGYAPNGMLPEDCGSYAELIGALHEAHRSAQGQRQLATQYNRPELDEDPALAVRKEWATWSRRPEFRPLVVELQRAQLALGDATSDLWWLRDTLALLPADQEAVTLRALLRPTLEKIATLPDEVGAVAAMEELRRHFGWKTETYRAYQKDVQRLRSDAARAARAEDADAPPESETLGESEPPPTFLSPALAFHGGLVYLSQMMAFKAERKTKTGLVRATVWRPVILSSDRRRSLPVEPPHGAPAGAVTWLDEGRRLALDGGCVDAPTGRWSYDGMVAFLHGASEAPTPHEVYDDLMASLRRYVYHADETSYVVDILWSMGTYFYRQWNAYPYLALHGEKGAGKTTLLTWLSAICFNAEFVVNTSEASLYRSIQAKAPTLLIDEQEGLNSSKVAREQKADLMGILKSGYKSGARVARQDMDQKEITRYFDVYSPKALAAIELFEDVLENRAILTYMTRKPADIKLHDDSEIIAKEHALFSPLRDRLYLLLMHRSAEVALCTQRVQLEYHNRMRELLRPLYAMAALIDGSRGQGRQVLDALGQAAAQKNTLREERDRLSPEATLREALKLVCEQATDDDSNLDYATRQPDGTVIADTIQVRAMFTSMFSSGTDSYFNDHWFGKQVQKMGGAVKPYEAQRRRRRRFYNPLGEDEVKQVNVYVIDPPSL